METYDFKNEIIDKNGNKINILDVYNFNKIRCTLFCASYVKININHFQINYYLFH